MNTFLIILLSCSVLMSVISLIYMAATPLLSQKYSSKWLYYIWLLVAIGWVFPFRPHLDTPFVPLQIPKIQETHANYIYANEQLSFFDYGAGESSFLSIWWIIAGIWALGVITIVLYHTWRHRRFIKMVKRWSEDITDEKIIHLLNSLKEELEITRSVSLKQCLSISTPMMVGFFHPAILLPSADMDLEDLKFILRHELIHLKRHDLWYKTLVLLATAVHWFNPVVYLMARAIDVQCEISNDEMLLKETSLMQRKQYGETLIGAIRNGVRMQTALSTDFYRDGKAIKTRIFRIMDTTKKSTGFILLFLVFAAVISSGMAYASNKVYNTLTSKNTLYVYNNNAEDSLVYKGPYLLEKGDIIQYDLTCNNKNLLVEFKRIDENTPDKCIKKLNFYGNEKGFPNYQLKVDEDMEGTYEVQIGFTDGSKYNKIKGKIKIIDGGEKG